MGSPVSQVAQSTQPQGKGFAVQPAPGNSSSSQIATMPDPEQRNLPLYKMSPGMEQPINNMMAPAVVPQPSGKGGRVTYPGQSGQPQMGQPNQYSNTVGPWDNASIGNQQPQTFRSGKGKGA